MVGKLAQFADNGRKPTFFYDAARDGMRDFLSNFGGPRPLRVLLPDWIGWSAREGSGVMDPVYESGAEFSFYSVTPDLTADVNDFERQLAAQDFDVVLVIHYFGRTEPHLAHMAGLVQSCGAVLIEDLAHSLLSQWFGSEAGSHGSMSLYALHKLLPLPRGGMARYSSTKHVTAQRSTAPSLASDLLQFDLTAICRSRRAIYRELLRELHALPEHGYAFRCVWNDLGPVDVPQTLPIWIEHGNRDAIYALMNEANVGAVSLYHTLIKELQDSDRPVAEMSQKIINLPVHQDIPLSSVATISRVFAEALRASA